MHVELNCLHLNQLLLVEAVLSHGSLSVAAERIGMSQSAASHALGRLRKQLNDPVFLRTATGMQPTPYGARVAAAVRDALQALRDGLELHSDFVPGSSSRTFNIIMSDVSQTLYLPSLMTRLASEAPGVTVRVAPVPAKGGHLSLQSGEADLAVGAFKHIVTGCRSKRLYREQYACIARQHHPRFAHGMSTQAFCELPHALVDPKGFVHEQLDRILAQQAVPRRVGLQVPGFQSVPMVVASSDMVAVMASRLARLFAQMLPLVVLPPPVSLPAYDVRLFWHERFHRDPGNVWLRRVFVELFGD